MYQWFERFCHKHERRGIKNLMTAIAFGGLAVFLLDIFFMEERVNASMLLYFDRNAVLLGREYWRLATFIFVPPTGAVPLLTPLILFFYHWLGRLLETEWGRMKLTVYYFTGYLMVLAYGFVTGEAVTASQLNLSLFLAVATLCPDMQIRIYFILPVKMKWLGLLNAAIILYSVIADRSLLPLVPAGNYLLYFAPMLIGYLQKQQPYGKKRVEFRSEVRRIKSEQKQKGFRHRCAVCGITDAQDPGMVFRYCSQCAGGKWCFCRDHISDHEHVR